MPMSSGPVSGSTNITSVPAPTDSGVCAISPSDLVGYVGNLINRVKDLEQKVAELQAGNVEVNQLSDLSQQVGWVGGITYAGVSGWTQTEYGTLIPPPGFSLVGSQFTLSDGNQYTGVSVDENGVIQFGFTATGAVTGASAPARNYVTFNTLTGSSGGLLDFGAISSTAGTFYTWDGADTITIVEKGVYAYNLILKGSSADVNDTESFHMSQPFGYPFTFTVGDWAGVVDEDNKFFIGGTNIGVIDTVPCTLEIQWIGTDDATATFGNSAFTIVKLCGIA
jgi:hypothetical protein